MRTIQITASVEVPRVPYFLPYPGGKLEVGDVVDADLELIAAEWKAALLTRAREQRASSKTFGEIKAVLEDREKADAVAPRQPREYAIGGIVPPVVPDEVRAAFIKEREIHSLIPGPRRQELQLILNWVEGLLKND